MEVYMRSAIALLLPVFLLPGPSAMAQTGGPASLYDIPVKALDGTPGSLAQYKGTVTLVVNVASQCGYTPQYAGLQKLYDEMKGRGVEVLGFPSNDFGGQEPGSPDEIATFCKKNYGVTFPMFSKLVTKAGPEQSEVYGVLGKTGSLPTWNFAKYLVAKDGTVVQFFASKVAPDAPELRQAIEAALAKP
jgi:glutathione peroxidase